MSKVRRALGLMSGTSMDGIDLAILDTDGEGHVRRGPAASVDYPPEFRDRLRAALSDAKDMTDRMARPGCLADVERELTERHASAVLELIGNAGLQPFAVDAIGFHGQTVFHRPPAPSSREHGLTVQLGDGPLLARLTGIDVVFDLRAADVAAGGHGAPLVPVYHQALAARLPQRPLAILNVGGVANVTYIGADGTLIAFDTGPGNAMIDDWALRHTGVARDQDGRLAAAGTVNEDALIALMTHRYFGALPPKSLDRHAFPPAPVAGLSVPDGAATLSAFAAEAIARARAHFPYEPRLWVVAGGGRRNRTLMSMIAGRVENAVVPAEAVGLPGDNIEAEAWAYLAVRALDGRAITFPGTTGVERAMTGGVVARAG